MLLYIARSNRLAIESRGYSLSERKAKKMPGSNGPLLLISVRLMNESTNFDLFQVKTANTDPILQER